MTSCRAIFLGTTSGIITLLTTAAIVFILVCAAILQAADTREAGTVGSSSGRSFLSFLFEAYAYFIDPGTQTGIEYSGTASNGAKLVIAVTFSLVGFAWVLLVFGVVIEQASVMLAGIRRRHAMIDESGHILILGWTPKTLFLIRELAQMLSEGES